MRFESAFGAPDIPEKVLLYRLCEPTAGVGRQVCKPLSAPTKSTAWSALASRAGKSTLFRVLGHIFGKLAIKSSGSTAAGIRQAIKTSSKVILCDEFEDNRQRGEILEMLRMSGGGDKILRGTTNQRGVGFGLQHIVRVAAIEVGLKRAADRNRFIMLELKDKRPKGSQSPGKDDVVPGLALPSPAELADLGQRLLAVAIRYIYVAKPLAMALKEHRFAGIDSRIVESYSVPAAMLAAIQGFNETEAAELNTASPASFDSPAEQPNAVAEQPSLPPNLPAAAPCTACG